MNIVEYFLLWQHTTTSYQTQKLIKIFQVLQEVAAYYQSKNVQVKLIIFWTTLV